MGSLPDLSAPRLEPVDEKHNIRFTDVNGVAHDLQFYHSVYDEAFVVEGGVLGPLITGNKDNILGWELVAVFTKTGAGLWVHDTSER